MALAPSRQAEEKGEKNAKMRSERETERMGEDKAALVRK